MATRPLHDLLIRPAEAADSACLLVLIHQMAAYEKLSHEVTATEARLRATLFGERPAAEALMAETSDGPVGYALFFHTYSTFLAQPGLYVEDIFVVPARRGRGIGKQLLARLAAIARQRDCARLEWAVLDWNAPALGFYRALGARPLEGWTVYRLSGEKLADLAGREMGMTNDE